MAIRQRQRASSPLAPFCVALINSFLDTSISAHDQSTSTRHWYSDFTLALFHKMEPPYSKLVKPTVQLGDTSTNFISWNMKGLNIPEKRSLLLREL